MIAIGSDHAGYPLKEQIKQHLDDLGVAYEDFGTMGGEPIDYPIIAKKVAQAVAGGDCEKGILICGTGVGMSLCANKIRGIRAACCSDSYSVRYTRLHNDANILCIGARVLGYGLADELVDLFLTTEFEGGRHAQRVAMITALDEER